VTGSPRKDPATVTGPRALVAVVVVALAGGAVGIGLGLRGHARPVVEAARTAEAATPAAGSTSIPMPIKPPAVAAPTPTPWQAPSTIAYVEPGSVSFPTASDGWTLGDACDAQQDCETGVARTTDGGATWAMVTPPVDPNPANVSMMGLASASSDDAWVWGTDSDGDGVFEATHDGGETWQPGGVSGQVVDVAIAGETVWAVTGCAQDAGASCPVNVLSAPVGGGPWTDLASLPAAVQGAPISNSVLGGPQLVRSGGSAWLLNDNQSEPGLVSTDDGGLSWILLSSPCPTFERLSLAASSDDLMLTCVDMGAWPAPQEVWASDDGGASWLLRSREYTSLLSPPLADVGTIDSMGAPIGLALLSSTTAWMVNDREDDLVTHDDGVTWAPAPLPQSAAWNNAGGGEGLTFANALDGWTFNSAGLWATTDGGAGWQAQPIIGPVPGWSPSS
jgi:hypothetical protein